MKRTRRLRWQVKAVLILILFIFLFAYFEAGVRLAVRTMSEQQMKLFANQTISNAVTGSLNGVSAEYDALTTISRDDNGNIQSLEVNTYLLNQIRSQTVQSILKDLKAQEEIAVQVPLGAFFKNQYFAALGPKIKVRILPIGLLKSNVISEFRSVGINQTHHRIVLNLSIQMESVVPFYKNKTETKYDMVLAETILLGKIPEYYTNVVSQDENEISKINDYGNQAAVQLPK